MTSMVTAPNLEAQSLWATEGNRQNSLLQFHTFYDQLQVDWSFDHEF